MRFAFDVPGHESKKCLVNQREVHRDTLGFNEALRSALREDPDIILVGEMRGLETIRLVIEAAEPGHTVFGILHTSSAAKTMGRIIDVLPAAEKDMVRSMLSESLQTVISQTLLKKIGCGRVAAHEIMICTAAIRSLIRESKIEQMYSAIQAGGKQGMQTFDQALYWLYSAGEITYESALASADSANDLRFMIKLAGESPEAVVFIASLSFQSNDIDGVVANVQFCAL